MIELHHERRKAAPATSCRSAAWDSDEVARCIGHEVIDEIELATLARSIRPLLVSDITGPYFLAAVHCEQAADDIMKLSDRVSNLESAVASAWKGGAGASLANSLVDKASLVSYAAGVLRDAAAQLRKAGTEIARAQVEAGKKASARGW